MFSSWNHYGWLRGADGSDVAYAWQEARELKTASNSTRNDYRGCQAVTVESPSSLSQVLTSYKHSLPGYTSLTTWPMPPRSVMCLA